MSFTPRPLLPPGEFPGIFSVRGRVDNRAIVQWEGWIKSMDRNQCGGCVNSRREINLKINLVQERFHCWTVL